ncbi:MAG: aldehyde dehydrogenase [Clostridia bacterium]|nr:aldehyde dehydrogenase [Clostridia bacterium]
MTETKITERSTEIDLLLEKQRKFFQSGATMPLSFRIEMLRKLRSAVQKYEKEIAMALESDLKKSEFDSFMCETGLVICEINYLLRNIRHLAKDRMVWTPLMQFHAKSYKKPTPYGNTLIMSPWNYPFMLTLEPLADAIAAGNTAIVKPSAYSPATSAIIKKICEECFNEEYIAVVTGGRKENAALLNKKFDFIFFTGSESVGKEVMRHAAEHLTPVLLELGGKSPCIVDDTAWIKLTAKRLVFGKFTNCGQTCVAPDYILCHSSVKDKLVAEIKKQIVKQYGENPFENDGFGKIINEKHFDRIASLIDPDKVVHGGQLNRETLQIAPTVMDNVTWDDAVMQQEIFGPVMPILTFDSYDEIYDLLADKAKPLALYIFSQNQKKIKEITSRCRFGGGCINDTLMHISVNAMGFGGVGESGMGSYHGRDGFNAFSHTKGILRRYNWIDIPVRYNPHPFEKWDSFLAHLFMR